MELNQFFSDTNMFVGGENETMMSQTQIHSKSQPDEALDINSTSQVNNDNDDDVVDDDVNDASNINEFRQIASDLFGGSNQKDFNKDPVLLSAAAGVDEQKKEIIKPPSPTPVADDPESSIVKGDSSSKISDSINTKEGQPRSDQH
eukprot:CAMPEP_0113504748 /NCGR_PEP_ID=MMETSP0014_2-20120614/34893_1 /TAXON_ID=2857 /ORGANISM="Nitzschia sp." /LENGTH=145 /DNA_ID=CAMNT_0000399903 /DNA_START=258 /DNA_END=692 /DNA_ORIENTATION=+ /assembly_acc=CAM_ASM_000159